MGTNWFLHFLQRLLGEAPAIVESVVQLKNETGTVSNAQEASDSLHALTGIAEGLVSDDPEKVEAAKGASAIAQSIINAASGPATPPVAPPVGAPSAAAVNSPAPEIAQDKGESAS